MLEGVSENHPYRGRAAWLASMHGKEAALAPVFARELGLTLRPAPGFDTDRFGTFTGEVERTASARDTALAKARAVLDAYGGGLAVASEGSFGPHPALPFVALAVEWVAFVDRARGLELALELRSAATNFAHRDVLPDEDITRFCDAAGFPSHALIVRPAPDGPAVKGFVEPGSLQAAIAACAAASPEGLARLETDMRAHLNPTRMGEIAKAGERLARRLACLCPSCGAPGWGITAIEPGLACRDCGTATLLPRAHILSCAVCPAQAVEEAGMPAGPEACPSCNP